MTHPIGYTGTGEELTISIGIDPASAFASAMEVSIQNAISTWNRLEATTGNLVFGADNNVPTGSYDFESAVLHELGHALGLEHVNLGAGSGLSGSAKDYTMSGDGANNRFDLNAGPDGVIGSHDDLRGDDTNLNYFKIADNDPFALPVSGVMDSTTYTRDVSLLPVGDSFSTNADRAVSVLSRYGVAGTEAVMQQQSFFDEAQRTLAADDVAGIRYAMSGLDEIQGTADDYTINLVYAGLDATADIVIDFDNAVTSFAWTSYTGRFISGTDHVRLTGASISFNTTQNWFFNDQLFLDQAESVDFYAMNPEPSRAVLLLFGCLFVVAGRRRARRA